MLAFVKTDSHIGWVVSPIEGANLRETLGDEANLLQLSHKVLHEILLYRSIVPADQEVNISASRLAPAVGACNFKVVHFIWENDTVENLLDELKHLFHLFSWYSLPKLFEVFQPYRHILSDQLWALPKALNSSYPFIVELFCFLGAYPPHLLKLKASIYLLLPGKHLQLGDYPCLDELLDLFVDWRAQPLHLLQLFNRVDLLAMALYDGDRSDIGKLPCVLGVVRVEIVELFQLLADLVVFLKLLAR